MVLADERFGICFHPEAAERDAATRARMIAQLEELITDSDQLSKDKRAELRGVISTKPGLNRYLRVTPGGLMRTDAAEAKAEENLDRKHLLRTADPKLPAEDITLGYKQPLEVDQTTARFRTSTRRFTDYAATTAAEPRRQRRRRCRRPGTGQVAGLHPGDQDH